MMKKLLKNILALFLCVSVLVTPVGVFAEGTADDAILPSSVSDDEMPELIPQNWDRGTTPPPDPTSATRPGNVGAFSDTITPAMKTTAERAYRALLEAPVEIFEWTYAGIKESTRMNSLSELEYVARFALDLTENCTTTDEKIYKIAEYLAQNIGYDHDYYTHKTNPYPPIDPYTVLQNGYTVCSGYAKTFEAMLQSLGIPCIYVYSPNHEWSAVHNGERWMLIDVTWMSNSRYEYGKLNRIKTLNESWYDFSIETALSNYNHVIEEMALGVVDGVLTAYPVYSELPYIYWPEGIIGIDGYVFCARYHFEGKLTIPDTVKTIGYAAFYDCDGFEGDLIMPASLISVDEMAFANCDGFSGDLIFGECAETVGEWAFAVTGFSGDLILSDSFKRIENNAFYYSKFAGKLDLGEGVQHIGEDAFAGCGNFTGDLIIPDSVTFIGGLAFEFCGFDGEIKLGKNIKTIEKYAFYACQTLTGDLIIPDSVTSIGESAFAFLGITGDIKVGCGIKTIPRDAFYAVQYACGDIIIPDSVQSIGERAFMFCSNIRDAYFYGDAPSAVGAGSGSSSFGPGGITLHYLTGASGWTDNANYDPAVKTWMGYSVAVWEPRVESEYFTVTGFVTTYNPSVSTSVKLTRDGEVIYDYTIEAESGRGAVTQGFEFANVVSGEYDLVVTKAGHLSYTVEGITVDGEDVLIGFALVLVSGDVNGDGRVDLKDVTALTSSNTYGLSYDDAQTKSADINGDKCFDLKDLSIIASASNYGKSATVVEY